MQAPKLIWKLEPEKVLFRRTESHPFSSRVVFSSPFSKKIEVLIYHFV